MYKNSARQPQPSDFPLAALLRTRPHAKAVLSGGAEHPELRGTVKFYQTDLGVIVFAQVFGLPQGSSVCDQKIFGFHIHAGDNCSSMTEPFSGAMAHFNPFDCDHPNHAGDLPPLSGNHGIALSAFLTDRFAVKDVLGRTVVIHDRPDDFTTQPAGNSGTRIACGIITIR